MKPELRRPQITLPGIALGLLLLGAVLTGCSAADPEEAVDAAAVENVPNPIPAPATEPVSASGVFVDRILFGQSAAFSGPAQELGRNMKLGIEAAFHEMNQKGGVNGRQLELVSLDDTYEPEAAIANTLQLIEKEGVFALIGAVGTPTSRSAVPVAAAAGIPYVAPFTGAAFLRDPQWDIVINLRASYNQETEEMVARLTGDLGLERIAVLYQDDSFGQAGYQGALSALRRRDMEPVAVGLYPRNTTSVKTAVIDLRRGNPEAVIMVGAYEPIAAVIAWSRHIGLNPVFITISFVGSNALAQKLGSTGEGVFVTQVVPLPSDDSFPVTIAYRQALAAYAGNDIAPGFVSLEGYLAGRLAIEALERCGQKVTRACFLQGLHHDDSLAIDGFPLRFGENDNQGSDTVFLTMIGPDGAYRAVDTLQASAP